MKKKLFLLMILIVAIPPSADGVGYSPGSEPEYQIDFGLMKRRPDGSYFVYKETRTIELRLKDTGFRWGYTIRSKNLYFSTYSIDYGPGADLQISMTQRPSPGNAALVKLGPTRVYDGYYWRWTANDAGDPLGDQKIEIYINGKLYRTIHFTIVEPESVSTANRAD
ncbi:MAG: hypothetical protein ACOZF0_09745 [Thermodesulfobacteriota bacterium]